MARSAENKKRLYHERKKRGVCPLCGKRPPMERLAYCRSCRERLGRDSNDGPWGLPGKATVVIGIRAREVVGRIRAELDKRVRIMTPDQCRELEGQYIAPRAAK